MDPSQRPDREIVAKEIDNLDGGRSVTQYDVLAWMQVCTPARAHTLSHTRPRPRPRAHTAPRERRKGKFRECEKGLSLSEFFEAQLCPLKTGTQQGLLR